MDFHPVNSLGTNCRNSGVNMGLILVGWLLSRLGTCMADASFTTFVMDQLAVLPGLRLKAMFGGHGLYQRDRFFGIIMDGRLYFKVDSQSRAAYEGRGSEPFVYLKGKRVVSMDYYEVPAEILENRDALLVWAQRAIESLRV